jgi:lipid-binding SYLF domain-containing protein
MMTFAVTYMMSGNKEKSLSSEEERVNKAIEVIKEMEEIPEEGIPEALWDKAHGIAVIPRVIKAAWVIGGRFGKGILVVRTERKITLGADASVAAGPVGRHAEASTDIELAAEIYSYSKSRGLFAGVSIEGAAIQIDEDANAHFYDRDYIGAREILYSEKPREVPPLVKELQRILNKCTKTS